MERRQHGPPQMSRSSRVHGDTRHIGKTVAIVGILFIMVAIPLLLTDIGLLVLVVWLLTAWGLAAVAHGLLPVWSS
jgi:hypothetical protein